MTGLKNPNTNLDNGVSSSGGQVGYSTNFSGGLSGGPEAQIISAVFKILVSRFVNAAKDIKKLANFYLYADIRQLITYIKRTHGATFRLVALSGILDVTPRSQKEERRTHTTRVVR